MTSLVFRTRSDLAFVTLESLCSSDNRSFSVTTSGGKVWNGIYWCKFRQGNFRRGGHADV